MSISFLCDCGFKIRAPDDSAGRRGRCPSCKNPVVVPDPEPLDGPPDLADLTIADAPAVDDGGISFAAVPAARSAAAIGTRVSVPRTAPASTRMASAPRSRQEMANRIAPAPGIRRHLYWLLLVVLIPLAWSTLHAAQEEKSTLETRLVQMVKTHPEVADKLEHLPETADKHDLCAVLPDDRVEGALLPDRTYMHWGFAAISGVVFLAAALLLFPAGHAKVGHLATVGVVTGTLGIILLLAFQWLAFHMPLFRGRGAITLLLDLVWLIGQSYRMALGDHGFLLSFLGFTAGVGFCEEACKALPLLFKVNSTGFSSWRSAMLWGLISGIGFGVSEGITYSSDYYNGISGVDMYIVRFVSCVGLHGIWSAAVAITIYRRQDQFRAIGNIYEWILQTLMAVIVPMVLHGLYDTLLKQHYEGWALAVAFASFGWLAYQIESTLRSHGEPKIAVA